MRAEGAEKKVWIGRRPSSLGEFLLVVGKRGAIGGAIALVLSLALIVGGHGEENSLQFVWTFVSMGLVFGTVFFLTCGAPWYFLGPLVVAYPRSIRFAITGMTGAVGACLGYTLSNEICMRLPGVSYKPPPHTSTGDILFGEAVAGAVIALVIGAFKMLQAQVKQAEAKAHEKEMRETLLAEAAAKAQSAALQSQINPHFFFNTLNTLSALIPADPEAAQEVVGRLAEMFRYTLACSRADSVTLEQELEFTENYLRLEQARFRERLRVTMPHGDFKDISLPGLSLQPLVENAIKYGVAQRVEGGDVAVAVRRNGATCSIDVVSPGSGETDSRQFFREGHALENVRDRLKLFAGERAGVEIGNEDPARLRVSLVLPK
jgi:Histidine kinase